MCASLREVQVLMIAGSSISPSSSSSSLPSPYHKPSSRFIWERRSSCSSSVRSFLLLHQHVMCLPPPVHHTGRRRRLLRECVVSQPAVPLEGVAVLDTNVAVKRYPGGMLHYSLSVRNFWLHAVLCLFLVYTLLMTCLQACKSQQQLSVNQKLVLHSK